VTGISQGITTFSSSNGTNAFRLLARHLHMVLVKFDTTGHFRWGNQTQRRPTPLRTKLQWTRTTSLCAGWMEGETTFTRKMAMT